MSNIIDLSLSELVSNIRNKMQAWYEWSFAVYIYYRLISYWKKSTDANKNIDS